MKTKKLRRLVILNTDVDKNLLIYHHLATKEIYSNKQLTIGD